MDSGQNFDPENVFIHNYWPGIGCGVSGFRAMCMNYIAQIFVNSTARTPQPLKQILQTFIFWWSLSLGESVCHVYEAPWPLSKPQSVGSLLESFLIHDLLTRIFAVMSHQEFCFHVYNHVYKGPGHPETTHAMCNSRNVSRVKSGIYALEYEGVAIVRTISCFDTMKEIFHVICSPLHPW